MNKTLRLAVLFGAVAASTVPSFAAMTGGNPRPQLSVWAEVVQALSSLVGF